MPNIISDTAHIHAINMNNQSASPTAPASGDSKIYTKSDGLYIVNSSSTNEGPFISASSKLGTATDYTQFSATGSMVMSGSARVWDDLFFPLASGKQGATDRPPFDYNESAFLFPAGDTSQIIYATIQFPHSWAPGTDIYPHVHWKQDHSGSVVYKMDYKWFNIGGNIPPSWTTYTMSTPAITYTSGSIHQMTEGSTSISGSAFGGVSPIMLVKLYRDDSTYTGNAVTYQFDIHFQKDGIGSKEHDSK